MSPSDLEKLMAIFHNSLTLSDQFTNQLIDKIINQLFNDQIMKALECICKNISNVSVQIHFFC